MRTIPAVLALDPIEVPLIDEASDSLLEILSDIMKILFYLMICHCVKDKTTIFDICSFDITTSNQTEILYSVSRILTKNYKSPNEMYI